MSKTNSTKCKFSFFFEKVNSHVFLVVVTDSPLQLGVLAGDEVLRGEVGVVWVVLAGPVPALGYN